MLGTDPARSHPGQIVSPGHIPDVFEQESKTPGICGTVLLVQVGNLQRTHAQAAIGQEVVDPVGQHLEHVVLLPAPAAAAMGHHLERALPLEYSAGRGAAVETQSQRRETTQCTARHATPLHGQCKAMGLPVLVLVLEMSGIAIVAVTVTLKLAPGGNQRHR